MKHVRHRLYSSQFEIGLMVNGRKPSSATMKYDCKETVKFIIYILNISAVEKY